MKIYDLEQAIMQAWQTAEDVKLLYETFGDKDMTEDDVLNSLLGIEHLHNMRCEKLFNIFEQIIKDYNECKRANR